MNIQHLFAAAALGLLLSTGAAAEDKVATALCNDGSTSHEVKLIACKLHGGIKTWYGKDGDVTEPGPAMVWVNPRSMHYHCKGDPWYGHTMRGQYMTRADAIAKGYRLHRGKDCP